MHKMNWILLAVPLRMTLQRASNAFGWFQSICSLLRATH